LLKRSAGGDGRELAAGVGRFRARGAADHDATNLRFADSASVRTLALAAVKARTRAGSVTLLNPQPPVARMLDLLCVDKVFADQLGDR
jgi:hypothetical protein